MARLCFVVGGFGRADQARVTAASDALKAQQKAGEKGATKAPKSRKTAEKAGKNPWNKAGYERPGKDPKKRVQDGKN